MPQSAHNPQDGRADDDEHGRSRFEYVVFSRVSRDRPIGLFALAALTPLMLLVPPIVAALAAAAVLAGVAISDAARTRGRPPEPPSPPG
ncbi:hypothetical protein ABZU25_11820 [Micromonospora sp. NPDC005215]|uniref:hypothetical protein n=1 Tax=Micromonospora sp. NPDC005215 TaxID=3157024 RepID=UPI0033A6257F